MKKNLLFVLLSLISAGILTGCVSANDHTDNALKKSGENKIEIEFWHCMGSSNGDLLEKLTDEFNQSQDEIYVKAVHQGSYIKGKAEFLAALSAGDAPVVAQVEIGDIGVFAEADQLVDMQKYVDAEQEMIEDFLPGLLDASYYDSELIALPHSRSIPVMYYNKDLFREHGLDADKPPADWQELQQAAKKLSKNGTYGYSCPLDSWYYAALMMCSDGQLYDEDMKTIGFLGEAGTAPLYLWENMVADGTMYIPSGQDYNSSEACRNIFAEGATAIIMQSSAQLKGLEQTCEFEVGVAPIPVNTSRLYPTGGANLVMFEGHTDEEQNAGWEFIKFMLDTKHAAAWANGTGYLPVRKSCMESESYKEIIEQDANLQLIVDNVKYCSMITFIPEYKETSDIIAEEIRTCILEEHYSPETAVEHMAERVEKLLRSYRNKS